MLFFPEGHEPAHILRPSDVVPALRGVIAPLVAAIKDYLDFAHLDGESGFAEARYAQLFHVEHGVVKARQLLMSWRGALLTAEFGQQPRFLIGLKRAVRIFLPRGEDGSLIEDRYEDLERDNFYTLFGGTALATHETLTELVEMQADLDFDPWNSGEEQTIGCYTPAPLPEAIGQPKAPAELPQAPVSDLGEGKADLPPPLEEKPPNVLPFPASVVPVQDEGDPLTQTLDLLPLSTHGRNLIKFLAEKPNRTSTLKDVCKHIYKSANRRTLPKARRLIDRNAKTLERRNAPLRIVRDQATGIVSLIDR